MSLILFVASGIVLLFLIVHKHVEVAYGRGLIMKTLAHKADIWFHARFTSFNVLVSKITLKTIVHALNFSFVWLVRVFLAFGSFISKNVRELIKRFAHKEGSLNNSGAASFYLKEIKESQNMERKPQNMEGKK